MCPILAHEGRLLETILKAERGVAFRGLRLVTASLGRLGTPPARHYDLAARSSLHGSGGNAGDGSAGPGLKPPRWSAERRASLRALRDAGTPLGARPATLLRANRYRCTGAPVGAPPTPRRGGDIADPGRQRAAGTNWAV